MQRARAGESVPKAHVSLLTKDTRLAVEAARQVGYVGPLGERVASAFAGACAAGLNDQDDSALLAFLRGKS
jgi:L-threonate 2-dehydrogenase